MHSRCETNPRRRAQLDPGPFSGIFSKKRVPPKKRQVVTVTTPVRDGQRRFDQNESHDFGPSFAGKGCSLSISSTSLPSQDPTKSFTSTVSTTKIAVTIAWKS